MPCQAHARTSRRGGKSYLYAFVAEAVQGLLSGPGASLLRAALSTSGAAYGVAVYHLARQHVRALRAEDATASESATEAA